jgi:hypothetical protein
MYQFIKATLRRQKQRKISCCYWDCLGKKGKEAKREKSTAEREERGDKDTETLQMSCPAIHLFAVIYLCVRKRKRAH